MAVKHYVDMPDGTRIDFAAPPNATPKQLQTLAQRAIKAARPGERWPRAQLSREAMDYSKKFDASISAGRNGIREKAAGVARSSANALGFSEDAAQNLGNRTANALDFIPGVGDYASAEDAAMAFRAGDYGDALVGAGLTAVGLIPGLGDAGAGAAKAMFLGRRAKNADLDALGRAEGMAAEGADPTAIWNDTGWFQGADKQWRFEVPDDELTVNANALNPHYKVKPMVDAYMQRHYGIDDFMTLPLSNPKRQEANSLYMGWMANARKEAVPVGDVLQHPTLAAAYPEYFPTITMNEVDRAGLNGSWRNETGMLSLDTTRLPEEIRSTAAHELDHFVQNQEGFARGGMVGTVNSMAGAEIRKLNNRMQDLMEEMDRAPKGPEREAVRDRLREVMNERDALVPRAQVDPYEGYRRLAGEVEARNVQTRLDWTPEQRAATPPWMSEDVPRDDQFVVWGGDPAASIRAWHGSPHDFDKFEWSPRTRGIGEGNQAFGEGLYFADDRAVAEGYRESLRLKGGYDPRAPMDDVRRAAGELYESWQGDITGALGDAKFYDNAAAVQRELKALHANPPKGSLYEVSINAEPEQLLDYDIPAIQQPRAVQEILQVPQTLPAFSESALERILRPAMRQSGSMSPEDLSLIIDNDQPLYNRAWDYARGVLPPEQFRIAEDMGQSVGDFIVDRAKPQMDILAKQYATGDDLMALYSGREDALRRAGVPGVRYRDGMSRTPDGRDTSNYVVWDDSILDILGKY